MAAYALSQLSAGKGMKRLSVDHVWDWLETRYELNQLLRTIAPVNRNDTSNKKGHRSALVPLRNEPNQL